MAVKEKGKQIAGKAPASSPSTSSGKRKKTGTEANDRSRKRRSGVLQFFDDVADDADFDDEEEEQEEEDEDVLFDDEAIDLDSSKTGKAGSNYKGAGRAYHLPFFVKEEELSGDELEELIKDRYGKGSEYVVYGEDPKECDDILVEHTAQDPNIWRVKCMVGREQQIVFCLMHKYADMQRLGTKMEIISAFSLEHVKGYVYFEADKEFDVSEACRGFFNIYSTRMAQVPRSEIPNLLSIRNKKSVISKGTWVRMKNGNYKGDLGQVVDFDEARKRATIKLVPRIDLQAIAKKFGGGISLKQAAVPPPRLISSHELEHFRPHIEIRRDRHSGETFDVLDGMMLKDGYLYKKVSVASIIFWGVQPSKDELLKFTEMRKDEEEDVSWLSSVYSVRKKTKSSQALDETSLKASDHDDSAKQGSGFNLHDLVLFGRKAFGVIIDLGKDGVKVLRGDTEGKEVMTVKIQDIKGKCVDKMFTASDHHSKTISINDTVNILDGPLEGKQGIVRHMYRGTLFLYDENQEENSGIFCSKSDMCENTTPSKDFLRKGGNKASSSFTQSPVQTDEQEDNSRTFSRNRRNENQIFSIGQTLRIRKGPLKGYLCRVVGIYRSDVTVKLDSLGKVITVGEQLLSVPNIKRDFSGDIPSDPFGTQQPIGGEPAIGTSSWEIGSSSWQALSTSSFSFATNNAEKTDQEADPWGSKLAPAVKDQDQGADPWGNKVSLPTKDNAQVADPWGSKVSLGAGDHGGADPWGSKSAPVVKAQEQGADPWGTKSAGASTDKELGVDPWSSKVTQGDSSNSFKTLDGGAKFSNTTGQQNSSWDKKVVKSLDNDGDGWNKPSGASSSDQGGADPWGSKLTPRVRAEEEQGSDPWGTKVAGTAKAVEEQKADPWGAKVAGSSKIEEQKTDPWGAKVAGSSKGEEKKADPWGTKSAQASADEQQKADPWGAKVAGSSREEEQKSDPWGSKVEMRDSSSSDKALDSWTKTSSTTKEQNSSWNKSTSKDNWAAAKSSTKSALDHGSSWDQVKSAGDGSDIGWAKPGTSTKNDTDGWNSSKSFGGDQGTNWENANRDDTNKNNQRNSWDNKPNNFEGGRGFGRGRGRGGNSWDNKPNDHDGGQGSSWGRGGWDSHKDGPVSSLGQENSWNKQKDFDGGGRGFGRGRGRGRFGGRGQNEEDNQHGSGDYNSGRGWGSGRGRGRGRNENSGSFTDNFEGCGGGRGGRGRGGRFQSYKRGSTEDNNFGDGSFSSDPVSSSWGNDQNNSSWDKSKSFSTNEPAVVQQQDGWAGWNSSRDGGSRKQSSDWGKDEGNDKWSTPQKTFGNSQISSWNQVKSGNTDASKEAGGGMGGGWDTAKQSDDAGGGNWDKVKTHAVKQPSDCNNTENGGWSKTNSRGGEAAEGDSWNKSKPSMSGAGNWDKAKSFGGGKNSDWNQNSNSGQADKDAGGSDGNWSRPKAGSGRDQVSGWGTGDQGSWSKPKPSSGESPWNNNNDLNRNNQGKSNFFSGDNPSSVWGRNEGGGDQPGGWNSGSYAGRGNSFSDRGRGRGRGRNFSDRGGRSSGWNGGRGNDNNSEFFSRPTTFGRGQSSSWNTKEAFTSGGGWKGGKESQAEKSGWNTGESTDKGGSGDAWKSAGSSQKVVQASNWSQKNVAGSASSGWNSSEVAVNKQEASSGWNQKGGGSAGAGGSSDWINAAGETKKNDGGWGGGNTATAPQKQEQASGGGRGSDWEKPGGSWNASKDWNNGGADAKKNDGGWGGGSTTTATTQKQEQASGWNNPAPVAGGGGGSSDWKKSSGSWGNAANNEKGGKGGW